MILMQDHFLYSLTQINVSYSFGPIKRDLDVVSVQKAAEG